MTDLKTRSQDCTGSKLQKPAQQKVCIYPIVETFYSVQGEGYWSGTPAYFIRLAGCDVGCSWCDQKETWSAKGYPQVSAEALAIDAAAHSPAIVVVTGGEPCLHDLTPLTDALHKKNLDCHLETSGAHPLTGEWDWITCSPKRHKALNPVFNLLASELKIVIQSEDDLRWAESEFRSVVTDNRFLQPEWSVKASQRLIFNYVLKNPHWRISLQTHKFLEVQ